MRPKGETRQADRVYRLALAEERLAPLLPGFKVWGLGLMVEGLGSKGGVMEVEEGNIRRSSNCSHIWPLLGDEGVVPVEELWHRHKKEWQAMTLAKSHHHGDFVASVDVNALTSSRSTK